MNSGLGHHSENFPPLLAGLVNPAWGILWAVDQTNIFLHAVEIPQLPHLLLNSDLHGQDDLIFTFEITGHGHFVLHCWAFKPPKHALWVGGLFVLKKYVFYIVIWNLDLSINVSAVLLLCLSLTLLHCWQAWFKAHLFKRQTWKNNGDRNIKQQARIGQENNGCASLLEYRGEHCGASNMRQRNNICGCTKTEKVKLWDAEGMIGRTANPLTFKISIRLHSRKLTRP